jgi:ABC-type sugar transport system, permease component
MLEKGSMVLYWYKNSLVVTLSITVLTILTSSIGGYIFGKFDFRGKNILFVCILASMMVPFQVTMTIMAPVILLFLAFQKQFIKGITLTGMK